MDALTDLFILRGQPAFIPSDNPSRPLLRSSPPGSGARVHCPEGSGLDRHRRSKHSLYHQRVRWENGYCESFTVRFRGGLLNNEFFYTLTEAKIIIEQWRPHHNRKRHHSALGLPRPAREVVMPLEQRSYIQ